jgi:hypothetical protein
MPRKIAAEEKEIEALCLRWSRLIHMRDFVLAASTLGGGTLAQKRLRELDQVLYDYIQDRKVGSLDEWIERHYDFPENRSIETLMRDLLSAWLNHERSVEKLIQSRDIWYVEQAAFVIGVSESRLLALLAMGEVRSLPTPRQIATKRASIELAQMVLERLGQPSPRQRKRDRKKWREMT